MMHAIVIENFGTPKVLQLKEVKMPQISDNKVIVRMVSAGVNPVDVYIREGAYSRIPNLPFTPGKDGAGIIHAVGKNVVKFKVNQKVFVCGRNLGQYGTYAEFSLVPEEDVFPLTDFFSYEEGAALGIPYFTAYRALVLKAKCIPHETVLVHGASGAVGLAAVQIAKHLELTVIGTAGSEEGMRVVKSTGADYVVNHKEHNYMQNILDLTGNAGVNIIIEMAANPNLNKDLDILAPRGRMIVVGSRGTTRVDPSKMMAPETQVIGVALFSSTEEEWQQTGDYILKGIDAGWVKPVLDQYVPLDKARRAHDYIQKTTTGAKGKVILLIQDPETCQMYYRV